MPVDCIYCHEGTLDNTANWVQCDSCQEWVDQKCDEPDMGKSYSGNFYAIFLIAVRKLSQ